LFENISNLLILFCLIKLITILLLTIQNKYTIRVELINNYLIIQIIFVCSNTVDHSRGQQQWRNRVEIFDNESRRLQRSVRLAQCSLFNTEHV